MIEEHEIVADQNYWETVYNITQELRYIIPKTDSIPAPSKLNSVTVNTDKPVNNTNFSLSGMGEDGNIGFTAIEVFDETQSNADRSNGTLDALITALEGSGVSGSTAEADRIKQIFGTDGSGNYIVRDIVEQRAWVRDFIHNPGLSATWRLFGGSYDFRTVDGSNNNTGTPIFINNADVERQENNSARGVGNIRFKLGGRL